MMVPHQTQPCLFLSFVILRRAEALLFILFLLLLLLLWFVVIGRRFVVNSVQTGASRRHFVSGHFQHELQRPLSILWKQSTWSR